MKKFLSIMAVALIATSMISCNKKSEKTTVLADSVSIMFGDLYGNGMANGIKAQDSTINMDEVIKGVEYVMRADTSNHAFMQGLQIGMQVMQMYEGIRQQYGIRINKDLLLQHIAVALKSKTPMDQQALQQLQMALDPLMKRAIAEARENDPAVQKVKKEGEAYLEKAAKEGYTKTASGLLYKVQKEGTGANFTDNDVVMVKYRGTHVDGTEFDKSQEPVPFHMNNVVQGFSEILKLMKPGSKVIAVMPYNIAYGEEGSRDPMTGEQAILPYETLIFEIETVGVQSESATQAPAPARPVVPAAK